MSRNLFKMRAARADREGYYVTRWDLAQPISVVAETQQAAVNEAARILGDAGGGRYWTFKVDKIGPAPCSCNEVTA